MCGEMKPGRDFSMTIQGLRKRTGLSQLEFSRRLGVNVWTLRTWEQGRILPEHADLLREALTARVAAFLNRERAKGKRR